MYVWSRVETEGEDRNINNGKWKARNEKCLESGIKKTREKKGKEKIEHSRTLQTSLASSSASPSPPPSSSSPFPI